VNWFVRRVHSGEGRGRSVFSSITTSRSVLLCDDDADRAALTCRHRQHAVNVCAIPLDDPVSSYGSAEPSLLVCIACGGGETVVVSLILTMGVCDWETGSSVTMCRTFYGLGERKDYARDGY
jgi:hypothetical protein